jgi:hypothetical protein
MEPRTKLVCNLGPKDLFRHPRTDGIWRATSRTEKLQGKKYYEAIQTDGNGISHLLGTERVELIEGGDNE